MRREDIPPHIVKLGLRLGATDVVASLTEVERFMVRFSNNEITISKNYREATVSIFLMIERHRAGSTLALPSMETLKEAVKRTVKMAKISPPAEVYAPLPEGPFKYDLELLKPPTIPINPRRLVRYVREAIDGALEMGARKAAGTLTATKIKKTLSTSGNVDAKQEKAGIEISVRAFTSDVSSGQFVSIATREEDFKPGEAGRIAGEIAKEASNPIQGKPGRYTALLGPMVFADLVSEVGGLSSAFMVDIGSSFLIDKIGSEVAWEGFTLIDDPTLRGGYGLRAFDEEGVPTRRNVIVERGVLKTYLHNSTTAKKFKTETTGNAGLINPTPWNLIVEPGDSSFEELLEEVDEGIYVTNDWYLRYQNYRTGDFSTIPRDGMFLIRDGRIDKPVRELRISDNMLRILKNIKALSRERHWIRWWEVEVPTLTPYALIDDLNFTKSTM